MKRRILLFNLALGLLLAVLPSQAQDLSSLQGVTEKRPSFTVTRIGHGRPMILIPGLLSSGDVWSGTVAHFKDRYECHVLTLAGFAGQPAVPLPFLQTVRDDVLRYIEEKKLDHPVIVGHSLGGFLAFWIAATAPDAVGPLVAVDGLPFLPALMDPSTTAQSSAPKADPIRKLYGSFTREQLAAQSRMAFAGMIKDPGQVETATGWSATSDPATAGAAIYEMMTTDLRQQIAAIKSPVLLLAAADFAPDAASRKQLASSYEAQVAKVPQARVVLAERARHFIMLDEPAFLLSTMDAFLKEAQP
ncbi:MAG TPA: alpha/beta hydrolase [Thermoanaerobaculia bacterium]|nr:alpha/beta hydrolase [Thermoanaerobaculia bacterium]